jgi:hypothetical protein
VAQELYCPGGADRGADRAFQAVFVNDQGDAFAFEKYLCKSGAVIAGKASAADGLNLANSMVRVMDTIALGYGDMRSPYSDGCSVVIKIYWKQHLTLFSPKSQIAVASVHFR